MGTVRVVLLATLAALALVVGAALASPRRLGVAGLSMLPGLAPGDVVCVGWREWLASFAAPRRHARWLVRAPDGGLAVKRIAALPGERAAIVDGDLAIDGLRVLTPPPVLAEVASPVVADRFARGADTLELSAAGPVYDDCPQADGVRRWLWPVHDGGAWGVIEGGDGAAAWWIAIELAGRRVTWRLRHAGAVAVVGGRLDGRFVAVAWPVAEPWGRPAGGCPAWPDGIPAAWPVDEPWDDRTGRGAFVATIAAGPAPARIAAGGLWRDILHRPPASGRADWSVGAGRVWLLGDFPAGSRDGRTWGPLETSRLVAPVRREGTEPRGREAAASAE